MLLLARDQTLESSHEQSEAGQDWQEYLLEQLSRHPLFRRRDVAATGSKGQVVLTGTVSSYYEKQVAQEFVRRIEGVQHIDNRIQVAYPAARPSPA